MKHYYVVLGTVNINGGDIENAEHGIIGVYPVFSNKKKAKKFADGREIVKLDVCEKTNPKQT